MDKQKDLKALSWFVGIAQDWPALDTDEKRREFQRELRRFLLEHTGAAPLSYPVRGSYVPGESTKTPATSRRDWTENLQAQITRMVESAAYRQNIRMPWAVWRAVEWRNDAQRYVSVRDRSRETIEDTMLALLIDLLQSYGHLVKTCNAYQANSYTKQCKKMFVAERKTGEYCSGKCKYRTFKRNARREFAKKKRAKL
jgi:hypothetical protein